MPDAPRWLRFDDGWECHVMPICDVYEHTNEQDCPCRPRVETEHPETGALYDVPLVIHNSWDLREVLEEVHEILRGNDVSD